jgi:hypothetical protein
MNMADLKAEIARKNLSIPQLARLVHMDKKTLYSRINGNTDFKQSEIASISKVLELKQNEIMSIFFADMVS